MAGSATRRRLVAAVVVAAFASGACELVAPELGETSLTVAAETGPGAEMSIGGTTVEARLEAFGLPAATWRVDGRTLPVPPAEYTLEVWTEHHSDAILCAADPIASGGAHCERDSTVVARCEAQVVIAPGTAIDYRYTRGADDRCTLEAA